MHRDHLLSSYPDTDGSHYENLPGNGFQSAHDSHSHEYFDLVQINTEDLMPLCAEPSQSLSQLINDEYSGNHAIKSHVHHVLPDLEEHDKGGFNFELNLAPQQKGKVNWFYSKESNKVYIKINEIFNIEAIYSPGLTNDKLCMRAMMVFNSEVSEPVVRCENHSIKDTALEKHIKHSVLRCENPNVTYLGSLEGKNVSDRLSVRIPLGCVEPNEDNLVKQTIALKFVCQNSCVGRRETSIIFYLENTNGEILAKRVTAVKICSCPKRDMKKDEAAEFPKKRARKDNCPIGKKIIKLESDIKVEVQPENKDDEDDGNTGASDTNDIIVTQTGVKLVIDLPDMSAARHVMDCAFNTVAGQLALNPDNGRMHSKLRILKKNRIKLERLQHK